MAKFLLYPLHSGPYHTDTTVGDLPAESQVNSDLLYQTSNTRGLLKVVGRIKKREKKEEGRD